MVYTKNLLLLALSFFIQLITRSCSLPLQDKMKIVRSLSDGRHSNNEVRRFKRYLHSYTTFLYARHTGKFIRVTKDGVNALARNRNDKHAELLVEQRGPEGLRPLKGKESQSLRSIKGKESQRYICMDSKGKVILIKSKNESESENNFEKNKQDCTFIEVWRDSGYVTYRSLHNSKWHLGFKKKGDIKHGHRTKHHHHAAWMMVVTRPTVKPTTYRSTSQK